MGRVLKTALKQRKRGRAGLFPNFYTAVFGENKHDLLCGSAFPGYTPCDFMWFAC